MKRIGCLLLATSLLMGGLGGVVDVEGFEVEVEDALVETSTLAPAPRLHREAPGSGARTGAGSGLVRQPARPPPLG